MQNLGRPTRRRQVIADAGVRRRGNVDLKLFGLVAHQEGVGIDLIHPHAGLLECCTYMREHGLEATALGEQGAVALGGAGRSREVADQRGPVDRYGAGVGGTGKGQRIGRRPPAAPAQGEREDEGKDRR